MSERKPMLSDEEAKVVRASQYEVNPDGATYMTAQRSALNVRDRYEKLIEDGTLIRRDELATWLNTGFLPNPPAKGSDSFYDGSAHTLRSVIDHINKKP